MMYKINSFFVIYNSIDWGGFVAKQDRFYFFYDTMAGLFDSIVCG
nr:MAG TPA: hypothetical protein [Caudoviricetes sp.]